MLKFFLVAVGLLALIVFVAGRRGDDRAAFGKCIEKHGVVVGDSTEFSDLTSGIDGYDSVGQMLDEHSLSIRTPDSEGFAFVTQSEDDAREADSVLSGYLSGYTTQRAGKVVVAWSVGPEDAAASAVRACA